VKNLHWILALAVAACATGCILVSAQIFTTFDISDLHVTHLTGMDKQDVDLNTLTDYADHKEEFKTLADFAFVGDFAMTAGDSINVEIWITPTQTAYSSASQVHAAGKRLWGPFSLSAATPRHLGWNESAALLDSTGKNVMINEARGDGQFTLYCIGLASGNYAFNVTNGKLLLTLDVGK
jgi:hypothetical protein